MTIHAIPISGTGIVSPETHLVRAHGPFQLRRIRPGISFGQAGDAGFGGLGVIDHAKLQPGLVVGMHEHRNDEIISYMRAGRMKHTDSAGRSEVLSSDRLMVMNAGRGFSHEEEVVGADQIEMLQIFVRPEASDLTPDVQFVDLDESGRDVGGASSRGRSVRQRQPSFVRPSTSTIPIWQRTAPSNCLHWKASIAGSTSSVERSLRRRRRSGRRPR